MNAPVGAIEFISALESEARTLSEAGVPVTVCGVGGERAAAATERLLRRGPQAVVSWGIAGGLDPALPAGALFRPAEIVDERGRSWQTATPGARGRLLTTAQPIIRPNDKRSAWQATHARAADMESAAIARVCSDHGVAVLVVRAIGDPASRRLPDWIGRMVDVDGRARARAALAAGLRHPTDLPALCLCAWDLRRALRSLRAAAAQPTLPWPAQPDMNSRQSACGIPEYRRDD